MGQFLSGLFNLFRDTPDENPTIDGYSRLDTAIPGGLGFDAVQEDLKFLNLMSELMRSIGDPNPRSTTRYHSSSLFPAEKLQEEGLSCSPNSDSVSSERTGHFVWNSVSGGYLDSSAGVGGFEEKEAERWLKHYSSRQSILLVGEGDFSFSASLAMAFGSASNIVATSLNTESFLRKNYRNAMSNIQKLTSRGAKVLHGVDATEMATHPLLRDHKFDRIIFNFPLSGFFHNESAESVLRRHRELVRLFMANAKKMLGSRGEIHITHKSSRSYKEWQLEELGSSEGLRLIEEVPFNPADYPGYENKYGFGGDKNFPCYPCNTYKFGLRRKTRRLGGRGRKENLR